jgi:hypothetical protein
MTQKFVFFTTVDEPWTGEQIEQFLQHMDDATETDVSPIAVRGNVELLTPEELNEFADEIKEAVNE